ncbi:MAG: type ISP restriction/modification enzyme, partial [Candidatus Omnitrophota bacterium]
NKNTNQPADSTLSHLYGFEIMPTPYLLSLLRLTLLLKPKSAQNLLNRMMLTDTLNLDLTNGQTILSHLSPEDIPVIIGNPPYNGYQHHTNDTETSGPPRKRKEDESKAAVKFLIQTYLKMNGQRIEERVTKGLSAAYVQFIRLAQWLVDQTEQGIVAFVTNHAYLDNPTFRAMRHALMTSFDAIYILDLNGHVRKKESPNGTGGNIFDTRQGTAISFLIKKKGHDATVPCQVFYKEVTGNREEKYAFLNANDWSSISWKSVQPMPKFYSFKPIREHRPSMGTNTNPYRDFFPIRDIFRMSWVGIITGRDNLCYSSHAEDMLVKATKFSAMTPDVARETYHLQPDSRDWSIQKAQKDITESMIERNRILPILYRPFEIRYTYYTGKSKGFLCMPRPQMTDQMRMDNIALITVRQVAEGDFNHVLVSDVMADARVTAGPQGIAHVFPLYVYTHIAPAERHALRGTGFPNFHSKFIDRLNETYPESPHPQQVFYYIYAVLYSTIYRREYHHNLVSDFPAVPFTTNYELFIRLSDLGQRLAEIHLMTSGELDRVNPELQIKPQYHEQATMDPEPFISKITEQEWGYVLNGYRVMDKWAVYQTLRKGNRLTPTQCLRLMRTAAAVRRTISYQEAIDRLYPTIEADLLADGPHRADK